MFRGAALCQTPKDLVGTAGREVNVPCAQLSQLLTHMFHKSIGVSMGAGGRGGVRGLERYHEKINDDGGKKLRGLAINVYHNTNFCMSLTNILNIEMDLQTPTIIGGDFNTHSQMWSSPDIQPSPWAAKLEDWAVSQSLALTSPLGIPMCRGERNQWDTTINLTWCNAVAILDDMF
jgi:hypothetical protein